MNATQEAAYFLAALACVLAELPPDGDGFFDIFASEIRMATLMKRWGWYAEHGLAFPSIPALRIIAEILDLRETKRKRPLYGMSDDEILSELYYCNRLFVGRPTRAIVEAFERKEAYTKDPDRPPLRCFSTVEIGEPS